MTKLDKIGVVFNILLGLLYIPLSLFSLLMQMVSEALIGATNPLYIALIHISCAIFLIVSLLCPAGIIVSVVLRRKGYSRASFITQFIPLIMFVLNLILICFTDLIPAII